MGKDLTVGTLLVFYAPLLTEKQATALDLYHNMDYSLAEIATHLGVTRQCVRDFIKKGEARLYMLEETLAMAKRYNGVQQSLATIETAAEENDMAAVRRAAAEIAAWMEQ